MKKYFAVWIISILYQGCGPATQDTSETQDLQIVSEHFEVQKSWNVGLPELSGMCFREASHGAHKMVLIGDKLFKGAFASYNELNEDLGYVDMERLNQRSLRNGKRSSQWEAVACDKDNVFLMDENPGAIYVLDENRDHFKTINLNYTEEYPERWMEETNHRGEGMALLKNGNILVLKEQQPPLIIEFGPAGASPRGLTPDKLVLSHEEFPLSNSRTEEFYPLKTWEFSRQTKRQMRDFSEMAVGPNRRIYLLSDISRKIGRLEPDFHPRDSQVSIRSNSYWKLPAEIEKPEGLAIGPNFQAIVATDTDEADSQNVFLIGDENY